jgi:hypothetical protein
MHNHTPPPTHTVGPSTHHTHTHPMQERHVYDRTAALLQALAARAVPLAAGVAALTYRAIRYGRGGGWASV